MKCPDSQKTLHATCKWTLCDMIKGNESDVADIYFEILVKKKEFKLFCFILFS